MPMVMYTEEELNEARTAGEETGAERAAKARDDYMEALRDVVRIIDAAGITQLSHGVELGQISWAVKMTDAVRYAKTMLGTEKAE